MKTLIFSLSTLLLAAPVLAADAPLQMSADAKAKCGACHTLDTAGVGPAWKDIAAKYKGKKDAEKTLVANITKGGKFGWYPDKPMKPAMPPKGTGATDAQIADFAKFIAVDMNKTAAPAAPAKPAVQPDHAHKADKHK